MRKVKDEIPKKTEEEIAPGVAPLKPKPKAPEPVKKGGKGTVLKIMLGIAFLAGAGVAYYNNTMLLEQGYTLGLFGAYLPMGLGFCALVCFMWAMGGRKKTKAALSEEKGETPVEAQEEGDSLKVARRCNYAKGCPFGFLFSGRGFCGSDGVYHKGICKLSKEDFEKLFSD